MFLWCKSVNSIFQSTQKLEDIIIFYKSFYEKFCEKIYLRSEINSDKDKEKNFRKNYFFAALTDYENIFDMWNFISLAKDKEIKPVVGVELEQNILVFLKDWEKKDIFYEIISYKALGYNSPCDFINKIIEENFYGLKFVFLNESVFQKYFYRYNNTFEFYLGITEVRIFRGDYFYLKDKYKKVVPIFLVSFKKEDFEKFNGITLFDIIISSDQRRIFKKIIEQNFIDINLRKPIFEDPEKILEFLQKMYGEKAKSIFDDIFEFTADIDILKNFKKNEYSFINITDSKENDEKLLKLVLKSRLRKYFLFLENFYNKNNKNIDFNKYIKRLSYEYKVIKDKNFCSYFLFVYLLTLFVKKKGIPYIGRGSAASSLISFLLDITQVDPVKYDLFFERFLNYGREEPPDIDIDFSWKDRDYVVNAIFNGEFFDFVLNFLQKLNKIFQKSEINLSFSSINNCAMIATRVKLGLKGAFRVVARYLGMPEPEISKYSKLIGWGDNIDKIRERIISLIKNDNKLKIFDTIFYFVQKLIGFPFGTGTHPGGFCLAPDKITKFCPVYNGVKGFRISGFDMYSIENTGLIKIDILSQRALGVFSDALKYFKNKNDEKYFKEYKKLFLPIEISGIINENEISERLKNGDSLGCFYIESPAMRILLKQLKCKNYLELVAASSVIRPGVSESGMKDKYIFYKNNPDKVKYIIPELKDILSETYGIMIYQEDVMKVAHIIGGLSYEKADLLRKGMSGKLRSREKMKELENDFKRGALEKGVDEKKVNLIWKYMESFAGYSFCKAHSASYATLSYKLLYLKIKYPELFYANVIANKGGYYPTFAYVYKAVCEGVKFIKSNIKLYSTKTQVLEVENKEKLREKWGDKLEEIRKVKQKEKVEKLIIIGLDHLTFLNEDDLAFFSKYENGNGTGSFFSLEDFFEKYISFINDNKKKINKIINFEKFIKLGLVGFFDPFFDNYFDLFLSLKKIFDKFDKIGNNIYYKNDNYFDKYSNKIYSKTNYYNSESILNEVFQSFWEWKYYGFFIGKTPFDFLNILKGFDFSEFAGFNQNFVKKLDKLKKDFEIYNKLFFNKSDNLEVYDNAFDYIEKNNLFSLKNGEILKIGFFITGREAYASAKEKNGEKDVEKKLKKMGFATFFDGKDFFEVVIFPDIFEDFLLKIKGSSFFLLKLKILVNFGVETYELISIKNIFNFLNLF